ETVLIRIADFMDQREEMRSKVTTAMFYPMAMALVGVGVVTLLMVKVVPGIAEMFEGQGAELPFTTSTLILLSDIIAGYWWLLIMMGIGAVTGFRKWRATTVGRELSDRFILWMPVVGQLARKIAIARLARTPPAMPASGLPLPQALHNVRTLHGHVI